MTVGDGVGTGKVFHYVNGKYDLHQRVYRMFDFSEDVIAKYFYYYFSNHFYDRVMAMTAKTSVDSVRYEMIADMDIAFPKIEEQIVISDYFANLDHLITLHQRKYAYRFNNFMYYRVIYAWEQRKLLDVAEFSKGSGYSKSDLCDVGTPIILYGRLYTKYETNIKNVDTFAVPKTGSIYSKGGEVIVPASGETSEDIARAATVENAGILLGGDLNIVMPSKDINSAFLALSISNGEPQRELAKKAQGKSVVHIHNEEIKGLEIAFPKREEQDRISAYFANLDHLITLHQRKLFARKWRKFYVKRSKKYGLLL